MNIISFAGHMLDQPNRNPPRFPTYLEPAVKQALHQTIDNINPQQGFASAACGADILFHEVMQEKHIKTTIILPFPVEIFVKTSVNIHASIQWQDRFNNVLKNAKEIIVLADTVHEKTGADYELASLVLDGLAKLAAKKVQGVVTPLVVWDGYSGDGTGGTAWLVKQWQIKQLAPAIINTRALMQMPLLAPSKIINNAFMEPPYWQLRHLLVVEVAENNLVFVPEFFYLFEDLNVTWQAFGQGFLFSSVDIKDIVALFTGIKEKNVKYKIFFHSAVVLFYQQQVFGKALETLWQDLHKISFGSIEQSITFKAIASFYDLSITL